MVTKEEEVYDGVLVVGQLTSFSPVRRKADGQIVDGLFNCEVRHSTGSTRLSVQASIRQINGDLVLPAYDVLRDPETLGKNVVVRCAVQNQNGFTNLLATNAKVA